MHGVNLVIVIFLLQLGYFSSTIIISDFIEIIKYYKKAINVKTFQTFNKALHIQHQKNKIVAALFTYL